MPDWSYQTILRPLLFRLRPEAGRDIALGAMGMLARLPGGVRVIQLMGHMAPDPRLRVTRAGITFRSPVGLGCQVDSALTATGALAELGFGYLEIGPVCASASDPPAPIERDAAAQTLSFPPPQAMLTADEARTRLAQWGAQHVPVFARVAPASPAETAQIIAALAPHVAALVATPENLDVVLDALPALGDKHRPVFVAMTPRHWEDPATRRRCSETVNSGRVAGVIVEASDHEPVLQFVRDMRHAFRPDITLIAASGLHVPGDALDAVSAGADLVQIDSGLVFSGPGLAKRINDALLYRQLRAPATTESLPTAEQPPRLAQQSWFWALLLGLSLLGGGVLAMAIATTRVTLPYDEALTGLTRDQIAAINPRLLSFMTHDRVTLAGTMLAVGLQYVLLAAYGIRRGQHWALVALATSALAGFFTFFAFLGFGYFDPFHAFVSTILLQLTFLAMLGRLPPREFAAAPELDNNEAWRSHQWGQLLFVIHGAVLIVAGCVIVGIGMTRVFIREDLEFLGTTIDALIGAHPQLRPLVAHDRATFGGMLIACGLATLLSALWGFQRGQAWLWWSLMIAGNIAYLAALAVHMNVGYTSHLHLLPVYGGLAWLWAGGLFSYPFMAGRDELLDAAWQRRLAC